MDIYKTQLYQYARHHAVGGFTFDIPLKDINKDMTREIALWCNDNPQYGIYKYFEGEDGGLRLDEIDDYHGIKECLIWITPQDYSDNTDYYITVRKPNWLK